MITQEELKQALSDCLEQKNPNANTCYKIASYYTILDHMEDTDIPNHSFATENDTYYSNTDFGLAIRDKDITEVLEVMDELMDTVEVLFPKLYEATLRKLRE